MTAADPPPQTPDELAELLYRTLAVDHDDDTIIVGYGPDEAADGYQLPRWGDARGECKRVADILRAHGYSKRPTYTRQGLPTSDPLHQCPDCCPDCRGDQDDHGSHAAGCRRIGTYDRGLQCGPPWKSWPGEEEANHD